MNASTFSFRTLGTPLLLALAYGAALPIFDSAVTVAATIGVMVGLFATSYPASNALDVLLADDFGTHQLCSTAKGAAWVAANVLTLVVGCLTIYLSLIHLVRITA
ncbi:MAG: hypothetical protein IT305_15265 [Chloroflexi bacterium]|nr:hypothetical protein [Chloroflexota bacterium]